MTERTLSVCLAIGALSSGLVAGTFFAFSTFVMRALDRLPSAQAIAAMQAVNVAVLTPLFMGVLFGTALLSGVLVISSVPRLPEPRALFSLAAAMCYLLAIAVTVVGNVPLNDALAKIEPTDLNAAGLWRDYSSRWALWNHVRGLCALGSSACCIRALCC
jgi:uncharacterized membrane protein